MKNSIEKRIIGLMSGTSLDGLDIAYCLLRCDEEFRHVDFELLAAETIPYPDSWTKRLAGLVDSSAYEYALTDVELGHYMGRCVRDFRQRHEGAVDAIASHGHTIFHQPHLGLTTQIGDGNAIAAETGLPVVYNFRQLDVALGGQGAPLVPIGDKLLFGQYDGCLNLGGFSNISYEIEKQRIAYDVSPCNMALNYLANLNHVVFDIDGMMARQGKLNDTLLQRFNSLDYYGKPLPKSLGKEWFDSKFRSLLATNDDSTETVNSHLRTVVEHIAQQVGLAVKNADLHSLLVTGGGAKNGFLIERIKVYSTQCEIVVPKSEIIDYKEAIIFALLGFLRLYGKANCLRSVTGASTDNCGGCIAGLV